MTEFHFHNPEYLYFLVLLFALFFVLRKIQNKTDEALLRFVAAENLAQLLKGKSNGGAGLKRFTHWLGLVLLVLALARPQANPIVEERDQASLDILVLLDISRSMDAEDIAPSRLKKAKRTINRLLDQLSGDRVGILAFAGTSALIAPLTSDYEMLRTSLQNIDSSLIESQGTNFSGALKLALSAMERGAQTQSTEQQRTNIFLILSDGEDHHEEDLKAVDIIKAKGGVIYSIAFGTEKGVPIPVRNAQGELSGYKRDRAGNPVVSKVNARSLQELAKRGGGQFYFSTIDEGEISDLLRRTQGLARVGGATMKAKMYQEYFYYFLLFGFICLLFSFLPMRWAWKKISSVRAKTQMIFIFILFPLTSAYASPFDFLWDKERRLNEESIDLAQKGKTDEAVNSLKSLQAENPDSPQVNYNMGTFLADGKKYKDGREQLERALHKDNPLRSQSLFNIAGTYAQEGKKEEARAAYAELLHDLYSKNKRTEQEEKLLAMVRNNLANLANPQSQEQQKKNQEEEKKDKQGSEGEKQKDNKQSKPDDKNQGEQKDSKKDDKEPKDPQKDNKQDKKEEKKDQEQKNESQNNSENPQQIPKQGKQPFKERQDMGEEEAKKILEALKQQETNLQKKFLKNKAGESKLNSNDDSKDW